MLVLRLELHSARTGKVTEIGTTTISNVGVGAKPTQRNYEVKVGRKTDAGNIVKVFTNPLRTGLVKNYSRNSYNVWRLVIRALRAAFPEER